MAKKSDRDICDDHIKKCFPGSKIISIDWNPNQIAFRCKNNHDFKLSWIEVKNGKFCNRCDDISSKIEVTLIKLKPSIMTILKFAKDVFNDYTSS